MLKPDAWASMPSSYHAHDLEVQTFRATSAAMCATKELLESCMALNTVRGHLMLAKTPLGTAEETAQWLIRCKEDFPCVLDSWWSKHVALFPTVTSVLSESSLSDVRLGAEAAELENCIVEAGNASIKRNISKTGLQ